MPPLARAPQMGKRRKAVFVRLYPDESWRSFREGIVFQQIRHETGTLQDADQQVGNPWGIVVRPESSKPQLPVQSRHVGQGESRAPIGGTHFPGEFVGLPLCSVHATFDDEFGSGRRHDGEKSVRVAHPKGTEVARHPGQRVSESYSRCNPKVVSPQQQQL